MVAEIVFFSLASERLGSSTMALRKALFLISVSCAIFLFVQTTEAQRDGWDSRRRGGPQGSVDKPIPGRRPPSTSTTTTTRRPSNGCSCPTTTEYNPVCGTDGVSYSNPGKLNCAKRCGQNVSLLHYGNCSPADPNAPSSSSTTTPSSTTPRRRG